MCIHTPANFISKSVHDQCKIFTDKIAAFQVAEVRTQGNV